VGKLKFHHIWLFLEKYFDYTCKKHPQMASPGKNLSDAHIAATGRVTRFNWSNGLVLTVIYTSSGQTFRYVGKH